MSEKIERSTFIYYKDDPMDSNIFGIKDNRIVEVPNFVTPEEALGMIGYFKTKSELWGDIAFYGSSGMGIQPRDPTVLNFRLPVNFFEDLKDKFKVYVEEVFGRPVKANTSHAQKWDVGGFASPHSDNSDSHGEPNAFEINKYVAILYLNEDYEGGELYFPDHEIEFRPAANSLIIFPGGVENMHGVKEITSGTRYTMVSFWDFAESEYSEETVARWEAATVEVRKEQLNQKLEWSEGKF